MGGRRGGVLVKLLGSLLLLVVVVGGLVAAWLGKEVDTFLTTAPSTAHEARVIEIPRGAGPQTVSSVLAEHGVVTDAERFALFLRFREAAGGLRAGEFRFHTDMLPDDVLAVLLDGAEVTYPITFPEGLRIEELATRVEQAGVGPASEYIRLARDKAWIAKLDLPIPAPDNLEGLLLPETYNFPAGATVEDVVRTQVQRWVDLWDEQRVARAAELKLTPYEITVLASIIEKETGVADERPHIGGVFHNRLRKGMKLQSDPTIIYGLKNYRGNIRKKDILNPHPWNTYVIPGLPPTPIAGPGVAAIDAALWPMATRDLYFVATGGGAHDFSPTYAEHSRKVRHYQVQGKRTPYKR